MRYRALETGEAFAPGDEILLDDCKTWSPLELEGQDRIMSRSTFDPSIHVPTRRPVG